MTRILRSSAPSHRAVRGALLLLGCLLAGLLAGCGGGSSAVSTDGKVSSDGAIHSAKPTRQLVLAE